MLRSALLEALGFRHGFSLRGGAPSGPMEAPMVALRGAGGSAQSAQRDGERAPLTEREERGRLADRLGFGLDHWFEVHQVHGAVVRQVRAADDTEEVRRAEADAVVAIEPGLAVAVRTADCVPLLVADPDSGMVAAVHAGWRGLVAGVIPAAIDTLLSVSGSQSVALRVAIFPHISLDHFEVGDDVAERLMSAAHGRSVVRRGPGKPHADLKAVALAQLEALEIPLRHIDVLTGCTMAEPARFHSYRRDGSGAGRHFTVIRSR